MMGNSKPHFFLIYLSVFVSVVAFSMVFPLLPVYAKHFQASNVTIGLLAASFALAQLLFSPFWGILSDRFGRKPIILIGLFGLSLSFLVFAFAANLATLFISRFIQGFFSGATMPSARAYVADLTTKEERIKAMGQIGAALSLGIILGPAIGGFLAQESLVFPFLAASSVGLLNFLLMFLFLPESLKVKQDISLTIKLAWVSLPRIWRGIRGPLMPLFVLGLVWSFVVSNNQVNVPLLGAEQFALGTQAIGIGFAIMGLVSAFTQFFLLTPITKLIGEHKTIAGGLSLLAISFITMPFLPTQVVYFYLVMFLAGIGSSVARPVITALITKESTEPQGATLGTSSAFESLGRLIGPLLGGMLFIFGFQAPFLFSGTITLLVVFLVWRHTNFLQQGKQKEVPS